MKLLLTSVLLLSSYPAWAQETTDPETPEAEEFYSFILDVALDTPTCVFPNWLYFWFLLDYDSAPKPDLAYLGLCISGNAQSSPITFRAEKSFLAPPRGLYGWYGRTRVGRGR